MHNARNVCYFLCRCREQQPPRMLITFKKLKHNCMVSDGFPYIVEFSDELSINQLDEINTSKE